MRIALVAGETSGDLLAGLLLDGLKARWPDLHAFGIGGARMAERGFEAWWPCDKLAVRGYIEVLRHYREITGIRAQLKTRLLDNPPDVFIGVDAPDFNLDLALALRERGIKTIQFVSPSIWAWRGERIEKIKRSVDHVLCIFPFEPALYAKHGVSASYVGHPLASVIPLLPDRAKARVNLQLPPDAPVVAVLPGSRASEIQYLGETFAQTSFALLQESPQLHVLVPAVPLLHERIVWQFEKVSKQFQDGAALLTRVHVLRGQSHLALTACDVSLVASGTATLEAALLKRPMVIAYKMNGLSWLMMRRMKYQPWVGLPNILCEDFVVPEMLQGAASPQALKQAVQAWLSDPTRTAQVALRFTDLHAQLLRDTPTLAASDVAAVLAAPSHSRAVVA